MVIKSVAEWVEMDGTDGDEPGAETEGIERELVPCPLTAELLWTECGDGFSGE